MKLNCLYSLKKRSENGIYYMGFRSDLNKLQWITTKCKRKSDAIQFVRNYNQKDSSPKTENQISLENLLCEFVNCKTVRSSTQKVYSVSVRKFIDVIGNKLLSRYQTSDLEKFKKSLTNVSDNSINVYLRSIISVFSFANKRKYIGDKIFSFSQIVKTTKQPPLFITQEEFTLLLEKINNNTLRDFYTVLANTGMRLSELINLKWNNVSLEKKQIAVVNDLDFQTKSGKSRIIPMNEMVFQIVSNISRKGEFVFCKENGYKFNLHYISHYFKRCIRKAKLNDKYHVHTLRHSFASWLVQKDVPIFTVQNLLGHASVNTTLIYSHLSTSALHNAVNVL